MSRERRIKNEKRIGLIPESKTDSLKQITDSKEDEMKFITKDNEYVIKLFFVKDYPFKAPQVWINGIPFKHYIYTHRRNNLSNIHTELLYEQWSPGVTIPSILIYVLNKIY